MSDQPHGRTSSGGWVLVDIDGVLADVRHRLHHVAASPRDWEAFFAAAPQDAPLVDGRSAVAAATSQGLRLGYLTGRPERCRTATEDWLSLHGFPEAPLHMRGETDRRPARVFKVEALKAMAGPVDHVIDDDPAVVRAMRDAGFTVVHARWMTDNDTLLSAQERGLT